jgi:hypothetical protein
VGEKGIINKEKGEAKGRIKIRSQTPEKGERSQPSPAVPQICLPADQLRIVCGKRASGPTDQRLVCQNFRLGLLS